MADLEPCVKDVSTFFICGDYDGEGNVNRDSHSNPSLRYPYTVGVRFKLLRAGQYGEPLRVTCKLTLNEKLPGRVVQFVLAEQPSDSTLALARVNGQEIVFTFRDIYFPPESDPQSESQLSFVPFFGVLSQDNTVEWIVKKTQSLVCFFNLKDPAKKRLNSELEPTDETPPNSKKYKGPSDAEKAYASIRSNVDSIPEWNKVEPLERYAIILNYMSPNSKIVLSDSLEMIRVINNKPTPQYLNHLCDKYPGLYKYLLQSTCSQLRRYRCKHGASSCTLNSITPAQASYSGGIDATITGILIEANQPLVSLDTIQVRFEAQNFSRTATVKRVTRDSLTVEVPQYPIASSGRSLDSTVEGHVSLEFPQLCVSLSFRYVSEEEFPSNPPTSQQQTPLPVPGHAPHDSTARQNALGQVELHSASYFGHVVRVTEILEQTPEDVNLCDNFGRTPLHYAAFALEQQILRKLIRKDGNADLKDQWGRSARQIYEQSAQDVHLENTSIDSIFDDNEEWNNEDEIMADQEKIPVENTPPRKAPGVEDDFSRIKLSDNNLSYKIQCAKEEEVLLSVAIEYMQNFCHINDIESTGRTYQKPGHSDSVLQISPVALWVKQFGDTISVDRMTYKQWWKKYHTFLDNCKTSVILAIDSLDSKVADEIRARKNELMRSETVRDEVALLNDILGNASNFNKYYFEDMIPALASIDLQMAEKNITDPRKIAAYKTKFMESYQNHPWPVRLMFTDSGQNQRGGMAKMINRLRVMEISHLMLQIGPYCFDWNSSSLIVPSLTWRDPIVILEYDSPSVLRSKLPQVAEICASFNRDHFFPKKQEQDDKNKEAEADCQKFVNEVVAALGLSQKWSKGGSVERYLDRIRKGQQSSIVLWDFKGDEYEIQTHKQLSRFYEKVKQDIQNYGDKDQKQNELRIMVKGIERAMQVQLHNAQQLGDFTKIQEIWTNLEDDKPIFGGNVTGSLASALHAE